MKRLILILLIFSPFGILNAQERMLTLGIQYKPIFASRFFGAGEITTKDDALEASITPTWGHSYGMIIRRGFTKMISYEGGISYVKRRYAINCTDVDSGFSSPSDFSLVSYEIPNQMLIYIQLGERLYMNTAFGISLIAFASDVQSFATDRRFYHFSQLTTNFLSAALIANVGFEYRTKKSGFFYFGASFHNPVKDITRSYIEYSKDNFSTYRADFGLRGTYLTLDFRYFFHEAPIREQKNRTKKT
ncbi:MAG: hypothetical protein ACK40M_07925 [Flavobacteriales bacterium]